MNDKYLDNIFKKLHDAQINSKLVIFVGAGISKNSKTVDNNELPSWGSLINKMKKALKLKDTKDIYDDDYLKIPEILYRTNKSEYIRILKNTFDKEAKSNDLNELIVGLQPDHIITTNYDRLIENVTDNAYIFKNYTVINNDKSLINNQNINNNYLIKMHGDISDMNEKNIDNIVLKERDYLNYANTHVLISTFIKSLLTTHTFLFIGYSLRDNNLKLIMNWMNNIRSKLNNNDENDNLKNNVLLYSHTDDDIYSKNQEYQYYKSSNVDLVDLNDISIKNNVTNLISDMARRIYQFLININDYKDKFFINTFIPFTNINFVTYIDFINVFHMENTTVLNHLNTLFLSNDDFNKLYDLSHQSNSTKILKDTLDRTSIKNIRTNKNRNNIQATRHRQMRPDYVFNGVINNHYYYLYKNINSYNNIDNIYIDYLITNDADYIIDKLKNIDIIKENNYISFMIRRFNIYILNNNNFSKIFYNQNLLNNLYSSTLKIISQGNIYQLKIKNDDNVKQILNNELNIYRGNKLEFNSNYDNNYGGLEHIKGITYNLYKYIRMNRLFLDRADIDRFENLFIPYYESILITYNPNGRKTFIKHPKYILNSIDVDILTKFISVNTVLNKIEQYNIHQLLFNNNYKLVKRFLNLCDSYKKLQLNHLRDDITRYLILLSYNLNITDYQLKECYQAFLDLIYIKLIGVTSYASPVTIFIQGFVYNHVINHSKDIGESDKYLYHQITDIKFWEKIKEANIIPISTMADHILDIFNKYKDKLQVDIVKIRSNFKEYLYQYGTNDLVFHYLYCFSELLPNDILKGKLGKKYIDYFIKDAPHTIVKQFKIDYLSNSKKQYFFKNIIKIIYEKRNTRSIPDNQFYRIINLCIFIAKGYKYHKNSIKILRVVHPVFQFLYDYHNFDYKKVNIFDQTWQALMLENNSRDNYNKFIKYFRNNKEKIVKSNKLKEKILFPNKIDANVVRIMNLLNIKL